MFPTDHTTWDRIESLGFVTSFDEQPESMAAMSDSEAYGDLAWTDYVHHQNWMVTQLLGLSVDVLLQGVDVVWRHNPRPLLAERRRAGFDVQATSTGCSGPAATSTLEHGHRSSPAPSPSIDDAPTWAHTCRSSIRIEASSAGSERAGLHTDSAAFPLFRGAHRWL